MCSFPTSIQQRYIECRSVEFVSSCLDDDQRTPVHFTDSIPDYRLYLPIRNETYDVFDAKLHPIDTTVLQLRLIASARSGLPLSAFRLIHETNHELLLDHVRLSQYDIGR